jgi:hypothetical protein
MKDLEYIVYSQFHYFPFLFLYFELNFRFYVISFLFRILIFLSCKSGLFKGLQTF